MKFHITNLYNFNVNDPLVEKQHRFAKAGRELGYTEMGIFSYPVETDTDGELNKRIDGIISALEADDFVFLQLPTKNGFRYDQLLINKIKAYKNTKVAIILHDTSLLYNIANSDLHDKYLSLYHRADALLAPFASEKNIFKQHFFSTVLFYDSLESIKQVTNNATELPPLDTDYYSLCQSDFYIKKLFIDCISTVFEKKANTAIATIPVSNNEIHIGFGLHDKTGNYSVWVGVTMQSIIEHTNSKVCFHILHDDTLNEDNRYKLVQVASKGGQRVLFHKLDHTLFANVEKLMSYYTIGAMFRIMLPEVLPELSKILYLDADLFVNRDIKELWNIDISNYSLAAVPDTDVVNGTYRPNVVVRGEVSAERYFNSGVLYLNLEKIRRESDMKQEILDFLERTKENILPDQDALNFIYNKDTLLLDNCWNYFVKTMRRNKELKAEAKIYHYVGTKCVFYYLTEIDKYYFETMNRTPWSFDDCRIIIDRTMNRTMDLTNQLELVLTQIASGKKRIYYGPESFAMNNLLHIISIQEADYRILAEGEKSYGKLPCKKFSEFEKEEKGTYVVFVLPEAENGHGISRLEQLGLKNKEDFFVIPCLLLPLKGGYS